MSPLQRTRWSIATVAATLGCAALWFLQQGFSPNLVDEGGAATEPVAPNPQVQDTRAAHRPDLAEKRTPSSENPADAVSPQATHTEVAHVAVPAKALDVAAQSLNVVGPGPHDPHLPGMVPHPLDAERARIATENRLLQGMNDAMSYRKVKEMRSMLAELREVDPEDVDKHQLGYEVIADCIEFPGNASLTAAREFYDKQRHSPLRRFVRRICFENRN